MEIWFEGAPTPMEQLMVQASLRRGERSDSDAPPSYAACLLPSVAVISHQSSMFANQHGDYTGCPGPDPCSLSVATWYQLLRCRAGVTGIPVCLCAGSLAGLDLSFKRVMKTQDIFANFELTNSTELN